MDMPRLFTILSFWIAKSVTLLIITPLSFGTFVLGNDKVIGTMAAVFAGLILTFASFTYETLARKLGINVRDPRLKKVILFVEVAIIIWFIKRFAVFTGFGVANNFVVLVIAAIVVIIDEPLMKIIKKVKLEG